MKAVPSRLLLAVLAAPAAMPALAAPEYFAIDPVHTRVLFFVEHARYARSVGMFKPVEGGLWFDEEDWSQGRIELCLPATGLDMGDRDWNRALLRTDFFDASRHPRLCFRSTRVEQLADERGRLHGELTIRGETRPVVFDFTLNDLRRYSLTFKRRLGISARAELSRSAFGMVRDKTLIGDAVEVLIELEAQVDDPPEDESQPTRKRRP